MARWSALILCISLRLPAVLQISEVKCLITDVILDMAPTAFDDQYIGCEEKMEARMRSVHLLEEEKNRSGTFKYSWENAMIEWKKMVEEKKIPPLPQGFKDEHGIALLVYTGSASYEDFNAAVRVGGTSPDYYMQKFHYKVLHFYLTTALKLIRGSCGQLCQTVYRGARNIHFYPPKSPDKKMRFGQFTSTSTSEETAERFGKDSFFTLMTCFGVCIANFSFFPTEHEVLLPLNEVFTVTEFDEKKHAFVLNSTKKTCGRYNCTYLDGPSAKVGTTYQYCYSSASRSALLFFSMSTPWLFIEVLVLIIAVTPKLVPGF